MSSSLPSSRETPGELFGPELAARGPGPGEALAGALRDQVALDLGEQREERGHDLGLDVALAVDADVLLERHEGDPRLGEGVEDGHDLTQRPAEPGEFARDHSTPDAAARRYENRISGRYYQSRCDFPRADLIRSTESGPNASCHPSGRSLRRYAGGTSALRAHRNASVSM